jgi:valyl-tRNA synthetase
LNPLPEKSWDKSLETGLVDFWRTIGLGKFNANSSKPVFVIDTPPPYPSGSPHVGSIAHYAQIDMIARTARMLGHEVLFPIGIDRNGLPVEIYTEKKNKISIRSTPREKFIELCRTSLDELEGEIIRIFERMGLSGDFENRYRTDSKDFRILTQATFIDLWKKRRVYVGTRPTNYCVDCGTTIAEAEIEYVELPTNLVYFRFAISGSNEEYIPVASTRPELLCTCQAVLVNPEDERYREFVGKTAVVPSYNREVPIIAHPAAKPEFGTGADMVCSYGDYNDALLIRELKLKELIAIRLDGTMNSVAGEDLVGLKVKAARHAMIEKLQHAGLVDKIVEINHRTPTCQRSKTPIEIIPLEEYYVKLVDLKARLRQLAHKLKFHPESHRTILLNWIEVSLDWPISRRRVYATEVPVWYCSKCKKPFVPPPGNYYQPWKEAPPGNPKCMKCGTSEFIGDTRTFDTWMDSSVSALYITKYLTDPSFFAKCYPTSIRPQGKDIVRTWMHYSILRCWLATRKLPWPEAWVTGMGLDEKGAEMHKSKGNIIDPIPLIERYGAEPIRLWAASEVSVGSDFIVSDQRIVGAGKFLTKLWNVARLIANFSQPADKMEFEDLSPTDKWILGELSELTGSCLDGYGEHNFFIPSNKIRDFTWNVFAAHYIELAKGRAYGQGFTEKEKLSASFTLHECLKTILLLLAPISPFITEAIWQRLYSEDSIHRQLFPRADKWRSEYVKFGKTLMEFDGMVWNEKKSKGKSLKDPISITVPTELEELARDLKVAHNLN